MATEQYPNNQYQIPSQPSDVEGCMIDAQNIAVGSGRSEVAHDTPEHLVEAPQHYVRRLGATLQEVRSKAKAQGGI